MTVADTQKIRRIRGLEPYRKSLWSSWHDVLYLPMDSKGNIADEGGFDGDSYHSCFIGNDGEPYWIGEPMSMVQLSLDSQFYMYAWHSISYFSYMSPAMLYMWDEVLWDIHGYRAKVRKCYRTIR